MIYYKRTSAKNKNYIYLRAQKDSKEVRIMEKGNIYLVSYTDGQNIERVKTLTFRSREGKLLYFFNEHTSKAEIINEDRIIRIEGQKEDKNGIERA